MSASSDYKPFPVTKEIGQSEPIDFSAPLEESNIKGKTILITGGASGFGAGFARRWAKLGATVIIGDISVPAAEKLVAEIRKATGNKNVHSISCDVTDWDSQVNFFKEAVKLSPHGGIDVVVANAGIAAPDTFEMPGDLTGPDPPKPTLVTLDVNLTGVLYTAHLALFYLPRNPGSKPSDSSAGSGSRARDRHLLLMGSMASLGPVPTQPLYAVSKHGVLGLFRSLRATGFVHGVRVNIMCPYFIDTPIVPAPLRLILAGGAMGKAEDVVEGATRLVGDSRIVGRSLCIGPKINVVQDKNGEWQLNRRPEVDGPGQEVAVWEAYAHDFDDSELFGRTIIRLLNQVTALRGWGGWIGDIWASIAYVIKGGKRAIFGNSEQKSSKTA